MADFASEPRLGDVIDDHCIKCRRLTNHSIVSIVDGKAAKVRCRTCYHDHDFRNQEPPPSKKDLKKQELFKEVLATVAPGAAVATGAEEASEEPGPEEPAPEEAAPASESEKKSKTKSKKI